MNCRLDRGIHTLGDKELDAPAFRFSAIENSRNRQCVHKNCPKIAFFGRKRSVESMPVQRQSVMMNGRVPFITLAAHSVFGDEVPENSKKKQPVNAVDSHEGSFTNLRFNMVDEGREKTCPHNPSRINITYTRCKRARNVFHHDLDFNNIFWIS